MIRHALYLAVRSLWWNRGRATLIILSLMLVIWMPLTVRMVLNRFQQELTSRAEQTPLIIGAPGSRVDLTLHALYFDSAPPRLTTMAEADYIRSTGYALALPLHARHRTGPLADKQDAPIVGVVPEYFRFRQLEVAEGGTLTMLGECLLGAAVAERSGLKVGDSVLSGSGNAFQLAGDYPLKMHVSGILRPNHSPDDHAVFTDLQTAWVIDGIGHGHQSVDSNTDESLLLGSDEDSVTASAAVLPYNEITEDNIDSFHFHGDRESFPVTAVVAVPEDRRSRTLLIGRYATERSQAGQCVRPNDVIAELMSIVFRVEQFIRIGSLLTAIVTLLLLSLIVILTLKLREREHRTLFRLGCSRGAVATMVAAEILLLLAFSAGFAAVAAWAGTAVFAGEIRSWLF